MNKKDQSDTTLDYIIIIATKDRHHYFSQLFDSIYRLTIRPAHIIIIDSSQTSFQNITYLQKKSAQRISIHYFHSEVSSTSKQRNIGLNYALKLYPNFILFLDDDTFPEENYVSELYQSILNNNAIGAMGTQIPSPNCDSLMLQIFKKFFLITNSTPGSITSSGSNVSPFILTRDYPVQWLWGCSLWDAQTISTIRFRELYAGYVLGEDVLFSLEAKKFGSLWFTPDARLIHKSHHSGRNTTSQLLFKRLIMRFLILMQSGLSFMKIVSYIWTTFFELSFALVLSIIGLRKFTNKLFFKIKRIA